MGYQEGERLQFLSKRVCGLWLIWVALVILIGTLFGGEQKINMTIFDIGYITGFFFIFVNKSLYKKLSFGSPSMFQRKITTISLILMFVLLILFGGPHFQNHDYRLIWLGAFLAIGIHFIPFYFVHGILMIPLALLLTINAFVGIYNPNIDFKYIAYIDIAVKVFFGIILLFSRKPKDIELTDGIKTSI
ncbi:DUF6609 family protein [Bacillus methanolicus]|uniref:DUF6609 family protein n=1 Tax=Bacillus methanolicus TaxID=1471 RepID=UPI001ED8C356|nr:DUF6609 family protein [Bacillus methanolicus]